MENPDILANGSAMPFGDCTVENFLCLALLEHAKEPGSILTEMHRTMKHGAKALIWVPFYRREHNYPIDNYRYTCGGINELCRQAGFNVLSCSSDAYGGLFFVLSHSIRFMICDPHKVSRYNPLLYLHAVFCKLSALDSIFKLKYPNLYTGVDVVVEKE